jgi:hypothetical protein
MFVIRQQHFNAIDFPCNQSLYVTPLDFAKKGIGFWFCPIQVLLFLGAISSPTDGPRQQKCLQATELDSCTENGLGFRPAKVWLDAQSS